MTDERITPAQLDAALEAELEAGRIPLMRCEACGAAFWHPRAHCPGCGARRVAFFAPSGPARVYAATVNRRPRGGDRDAAPVQVGYVEFPEGVRMLVTLGFPDGAPRIGAEVAPEAGGPGEPRLVFRPVAGD
ncbi:MAG: OB-fold domain-containing protein [Micrococcales bacterium]|nr:OB-fold domain-containing protein [Micrococcales bacterium]OJX66690.1 MAG: hypothetical protein BGO94_07540 [Micrococcales bacterium 72-143]